MEEAHGCLLKRAPLEMGMLGLRKGGACTVSQGGMLGWRPEPSPAKYPHGLTLLASLEHLLRVRHRLAMPHFMFLWAIEET